MRAAGFLRKARRRASKDLRELGALATEPRERSVLLRRLRRGGLNVRQQHALLILIAFGLAWAIGAALLRVLAPGSAQAWDSVWALAAVSFVVVLAVPMPGFTTALLLALRDQPLLLAAGVLGASVGGTIGATVVFYLGGEARRRLERRAKKGPWSRALRGASKRFARRATYVGIAVLIVPPIIPRPVVLYAASVLDLKVLPYIVAVFAGTLVRTGLVALGASAVLERLL